MQVKWNTTEYRPKRDILLLWSRNIFSLSYCTWCILEKNSNASIRQLELKNSAITLWTLLPTCLGLSEVWSNQHRALLTATRRANDTPWITVQFRRLIRCRQNAQKHPKPHGINYAGIVYGGWPISCNRNTTTRTLKGRVLVSSATLCNYIGNIAIIPNNSPVNYYSISRRQGSISNPKHSAARRQLSGTLSPVTKSSATITFSRSFIFSRPDMVPSEFCIDWANVERQPSQVKVRKAISK